MSKRNKTMNIRQRLITCFLLLGLIMIPLSDRALANKNSDRLTVQTDRIILGTDLLSGSGLSITPNWTASGVLSSLFGYSAASAGDVNGDGYDDVIIGLRDYWNGQRAEGSAYVYYGSPMGLSTSINWSVEGNMPYAYLGNSVGTAGDVNGDGYDDVIIGAPLYSNGQTSEGRVFIYYGSANGLNTTPNWTFECNQNSAYCGWSVGTAGDVNGDGYDDVIVGAKGFDNGEEDEGRAFVFLGSASGLSASPNWIAESNETQTGFGYSVSSAGDVNGDAYDDVIIGSYYYKYNVKNDGKAYIYYGSASGVNPIAAAVLDDAVSMDSFAFSVGTAGDVNGDGYDEIIVGAPYDDHAQAKAHAYVYFGSSIGVLTTTPWIAESNISFGAAVGTAGDVNGDGFADIIIGEPNYYDGMNIVGRVYVYLGSRVGLGSVADWAVSSTVNNSAFGTSAGTAGDVNGDNASDVIVGAPMYNSTGAAFVYHGTKLFWLYLPYLNK